MKYYITQKGQSLLETRKRGRRHGDKEEEGSRGGRNTVEDEALEGKFTQERLKFLRGKK